MTDQPARAVTAFEPNSATQPPLLWALKGTLKGI